jgi:hypothetical protein
VRLKDIFFVGLGLLLVVSPALPGSAAAATPHSTLVVELSAAPENRPQLRSVLAGEQAQRLDGLRRQGLLQGYKLFFNRYPDTNRWDGLEVLTFSGDAAVSRWAALERTSPGGLSPAALRLVTHIVETPTDGVRRGGTRGAGTDAPTLVIPYQVVVPPSQYLTYVDTYVAPQFDGWIAEGVLDSYEIQMSRFPAGRPWASLILLRYHDDPALGRRDETTALVRRRLAENPQWKAASDSKTTVRTEGVLAVADQLAGAEAAP